MSPHLDRHDVERGVAARGADALLTAYGVPFKTSGGELRTRHCSSCNGSSDALCINAVTCLWFCQRCGAKGGGIDLVAALAGIDSKRDFPRALAEAADFAGIVPSTASHAERQVLRAERQRQDRERDRVTAETAASARVESRRRAAALWESLFRRDRAGEAYLRTRGLGELAGNPHVRFTTGQTAGQPFGSIATANEPAVILRDRDGEPLSVTARRFPDRVESDGKAKTPTMRGCPTDGTLIGTIGDIGPRSVVVVTEGIMDSLTALLAWPDAVVLGATGANRLADIVKLAASRVVANGGRLLIVPHADTTGEANAIKAGIAGVTAGLQLGQTLSVVNLGRHADLNDAWCAGWRP